MGLRDACPLRDDPDALLVRVLEKVRCLLGSELRARLEVARRLGD